MKMNEGEITQYYVRDNNEPTIPMDVLKLVRDKLKDPKKVHSQRTSIFGKNHCRNCGDVFGSKVLHSTDKYQKTVWRCKGKYSGNGKCQSRHVTEFDEKAFKRLAERMIVRDDGIEVVWRK